MMTPLHIFEVILFAAVSSLPYLLLALCPFTGSLRFPRIITGFLMLVLAVVQVDLGIWGILILPEHADILAMVSTAVYLGFYVLLVKEQFGKLVFVLLVVSNEANLVMVSARFLERLLFAPSGADPVRWTLCVCILMAQVVFLLPVLLFVRRYLQRTMKLSTPRKVWRYLWLIPLTFYLFWYHGIYFSPYSHVSTAIEAENAIYTLIINMGAFLVYYVVIKAVWHMNQNLELQAQNYQLSIQHFQYETMKERMEEARRAKHDLRHHMKAIYAYVQEKEYDGLESYLQGWLNTAPIDWRVTYCSHFMLNMVISYYAQIAEQNQIAMTADASVPQEIPMEESEITVMFGNLLENACQECMRVEEGPRYVRFRAAMPTESTLVFTLENSSRGRSRKENGRFLSARHKGTGIGVESVRNIVRKYRGVIHFKEENNVFSVSGMLNF